MDLNLKGKHALVTGSTAGIGYAAAVQLAEMGASVVVTGSRQETVDEAVTAVRKHLSTAEVTGIARDLGTAEGATAVIERVPDVDVLVNNVGVFGPKPFTEIPDAEWQRFFDVNVMSGVRLTRHYLRGMLERDWGRIVFVSSESGMHIPEEMIHYGVTKSADLGLARGVAELTRGTGVTCNSVLPGPTWSRGVSRFIDEMAESRGVDRETMEREFFQQARPTSLIQRFATPAEVANMIGYACSPAASATNGAALRVEGGVVRTIT